MPTATRIRAQRTTMPELSPHEMLQPSLLDRLIDEDPKRETESSVERAFTLERLRAIVLRDLEWLLNCGRSEKAERELEAYPLASESVLNYGVPSLAGRTTTGVDVRQFEARMRAALEVFEPRIFGRGLEITVRTSPDQMNQKRSDDRDSGGPARPAGFRAASPQVRGRSRDGRRLPA